MACKYIYKGKEYTEEEILSKLIGEDFSSPSVSPEIKGRIYEFVNELGFNVKGLDDYMDSLAAREKDFSIEGVNALIDLNNSVIALGENASDYDFIEEASHLGVAIMPDSPQLSRAMDLVVDTSAYKKNVEGYTALYSKLDKELTPAQIEEKVRKEILGKLVADNIVANSKSGISYRLFRTLKTAWNKLLSIFNKNVRKARELNNYIESVSSNMLNSVNRAVAEEFNTEGIFFSAREEKEARKVLNKIIENLENRLGALKRRATAKKASRRVSDTIEKLKADLERAQEEEGLVSFLGFVQEDLRRADSYINKVRQGEAELTPNMTNQLEEFLDYYMPLLREIKKKNNVSSLFTNFDEKRQENLNEVVRGLISALEDVEDFHTDAQNEAAQNAVKQAYEKANVKIDFNLSNLFKKLPKDANWFQAQFGTIRDLASPIASAVYGVVGKAKQKIDRLSHNFGRNLINKVINDLDVKDTSVLAEKINGKSTGYFLTRYRLGDFYTAKDKFFEELREKYKLAEGQREPYDEVEALRFRKEKDEWMIENVERRYNKDYYKLRTSLSEDTRRSLQYIDAQRYNIINKAKDENGNIDYFLLSKEELDNLEDLDIDRKSLASTYYENGDKKAGTDLKIAQELQDFNEKLKNKRKFTEKRAEFIQAKANAKRRLTEEDFKEWLEQNQEEVYDDRFWKILEGIEKNDVAPELQALYDKRNELVRPYRNNVLEVNLEKAPQSILDKVKELDRDIIALQENAENTGSNREFWNLVKTEKTKYFKELERKAKEDGKMEEFEKEHYYINAKGKTVPHSYATHIIPKNRTYIKVQSKWTELSKDSEFYNDKFDETWIGLQPSEKWYNSDYDKLTPNQKSALEVMLEEKRKLDTKIPVGAKNAYMLPQMSKSINDLLQDKDLNRENLEELLADTWQSRVDDDEFGANSTRLDGSIRRYVPVYYTRMLENPNNVSLDLVSSMIKYSQMANNYEEMSRIAPELEIIKKEFGKAKYESDTTPKPGVGTNAYKMISSFIDVQVYGVLKEGKEDYKIPVINRTINVNKVANNVNSYIRGVNLILNFFTMGAGYLNGIVNSRIEDIVGRYTTNASKMMATKEFVWSLPKAVTEFKQINKSNKMNLMLEKFRILDNFDEIFDNLDKDRIKRLNKGDLAYFGYGMADFALKAQLSLAVMFNYREHEGKFYTELNFNKAKKNGDIDTSLSYGDLTNIYDMMEVKDHKLVVKEEYKDLITDQDLDYLEYTMKTVSTKADGTLTELDRARIHQSTWGQLVATHRNWLIDGIARRWKAKGRNLMTGEIEVGYHREFLHLLKATIMEPKRLTNLKKLWADFNNLEAYQKEAVIRTTMEIVAVLALAFIAKLVNNAADDDDDNWRLEASAYLMNRVLLETSALSLTPTPLPYMEVISVLNSPVAGTKQIQHMFDLPELFSLEEVERGPYEGYTKAQKQIMKMIPGVKGSMSLRDPDSPNQFLKYSALKWLY